MPNKENFLFTLIVILIAIIIYLLFTRNSCNYDDVTKALVIQQRRSDALSESVSSHVSTFTFTSQQLETTKLHKLLNYQDIPGLTEAQLGNRLYTTEKSLFMIYLNEIVYSIGKNFDFATTPQSQVESFVQSSLPVGCTLEKLLVYTNLNSPFVTNPFVNYWYNSYGGMILKYSIPDSGMVPYTLIILRGTLKQTEWYEDVKVLLVSTDFLPSKDNTIHAGFNNMYYGYTGNNIGRLRDQIRSYLGDSNWRQKRSVIISGHSLGGGLANILMTDLCVSDPVPQAVSSGYDPIRFSTQTYTYAGPYFGNQSTSNLIQQSTIDPKWSGIFNIINLSDIVCTDYAPFYVRIPSQLFCYDDNEGVANSHILSTYKKATTDYASVFENGANAGRQVAGLACS